MKPIYFLLVVILLAYLGGCMPQLPADPGPQLTVEQSKLCYDQAQAQLSPQWAAASVVDRAVVALQVISICEGGQ